MLIYLVRHGETPWNKAHRIQGNSDIPLNDNGKKLAEITAESMKEIRFDRVYSSPLIRAVETAEILTNGRELKIRTDERLREMHFGIAEGAYLPFLQKIPFSRARICFDHPERYTKPCPGGETFDQVMKRAASFMDEELKPLEGTCDSVLITAHGCFNRAFLYNLFHVSRAEWWTAVHQRNLAVNTIELQDGKFRILQVGQLYYDSVPPQGPAPY